MITLPEPFETELVHSDSPIVEPDRDTVEDLTQIGLESFGERKPSDTATIPAPPQSDWDLDAWTLESPTSPGSKATVATS